MRVKSVPELKLLAMQILGMLSWRPAVLALLAVNTALCMEQASAPSIHVFLATSIESE
jgi:hypothetical protein